MDTRAVAVLLFVLCAVDGVQGLECPSGWQNHSTSCYVFVKEAYDWFDSKAACEVLGGQLAEIQTADENTFLAQMVASARGSEAWIGLEDILEEDIFVWVSSEREPEEKHWNRGEPDDQHGAEDCAAIMSSGFWFDANCETSHHSFICETAPKEEIIIG